MLKTTFSACSHFGPNSILKEYCCVWNELLTIYRSLSGPSGPNPCKTLEKVERKSGKSLERIFSGPSRDFFQTLKTFSRPFPDFWLACPESLGGEHARDPGLSVSRCQSVPVSVAAELNLFHFGHFFSKHLAGLPVAFPPMFCSWAFPVGR